MTLADGGPLALGVLERCFSGAIPAVIATASSDGVPNITFLSKVHPVDAERIALSNQFMSKTARNLAANPFASLLLIDPATHDEYRMSLVYERTERRGHVFERLRTEVDAVAELCGMQDVFRLRAATIFRVLEVEQVEHPGGAADAPFDPVDERTAVPSLGAVSELTARISRSGDLDVLADAALEGLDQLLGYHHVHLLLLDETGQRLFTIASRGFAADSVGAEVIMGEGPIGTAAARCEPMRVGNLRHMDRYSEAVRRGFEDEGGVRPGREVRVPGLPRAQSRLVVPAMALGQLVGVIVVESTQPAAFDVTDEQALGVVAATVASAVEALREPDVEEPVARPAATTTSAASAPAPTAAVVGADVVVRYFAADGSTFLDGDYLIKGVAGRVMRSLVAQHVADGRTDFTNRELRLDPTLELPGFKDNLESRLILLKRRLDERDAPVRIEKTGRGRFRLVSTRTLRLIED